MATAGCFSDCRFIDMIKMTEVTTIETKKIILKLRTERGMSQDDLADKVMVTKRILRKSSLPRSLKYLQEQFPDGKMETQSQILIHLGFYQKNLMFQLIRFWENRES